MAANEKKHESVHVKTFMKWECNEDFTYECDEEKRITMLKCTICTKYISAIRQEARFRNLSGQVMKGLLSYVDGVTYIHKSNVLRHCRSGSLHSWAKQKYGEQYTVYYNLYIF